MCDAAEFLRLCNSMQVHKIKLKPHTHETEMGMKAWDDLRT